jgi:hypothetical protein
MVTWLTIAGQSEDVLIKDSVYAAIGLSAPILESVVDFNEFLKETLVPEVQVQRPGHHLLRRRAAIVIGQWITVTPMDRTLVYHIFQHLLDASDSHNDLVVRVTAGRQFKSVMDPWDIHIPEFIPFAATILERLIHLTREVTLAETKLALLHSLRIMFIRMEHFAIPFADQILSALPPLWDQAEDEYLMKQTILGILSSLMTAIGAESHRYHQLILPLISRSLNPESESRVYLIEDALDLWSVIIQQAPHPTPELVALASQLRPIFESASENFRKALEIEELYIVLDPAGWLEQALQHLRIYATLLREKLKVDSRAAIHKIVEILTQQAAATELEPFAENLYASGLLADMLYGLRTVYDANQTTGPNKPTPRIDLYTESAFYGVFARILHANPRLGIELVTQSADDIDWFLEEWFEQFDSLPHADQKKLHCLGITALLNIPELVPLVLRRLQQLLNMWTDVMFECCENHEDGSLGKDDLVWEQRDPIQGPDAPPPIPDEQRRREVSPTVGGEQANDYSYSTTIPSIACPLIATCGR